MTQRFSLNWKNFAVNVLETFKEMQEDDDFTDVTLSCEGKKINCHKILLSACSTYFKETFRGHMDYHHPIVILLGIDYADLEALIRFMYTGEVNVREDRLQNFLHTAQFLKVKGLAEEAGATEPRKVPKNLSMADIGDEDQGQNVDEEENGAHYSGGGGNGGPFLDPQVRIIDSSETTTTSGTTNDDDGSLEQQQQDQEQEEEEEDLPEFQFGEGVTVVKYNKNDEDDAMSVGNVEENEGPPVGATGGAGAAAAGPSGLKRGGGLKRTRAKRGKGKGGNWTRRTKKKSSTFSLLSQSFHPPLDLSQSDLGDEEEDANQKPGRKPSVKLDPENPEDEIRFECIICGKTFKNKNVLYNHRSVYHRNDPQLQLGSTEVIRVAV